MNSPHFSSSQQLTVFISSTLVDLRAYRDKVEELLNRIETSFRSMKFFGSKEGEPLDQCLGKLRECNYYVGIIGFRYGDLHPDHGLSYTELEYDEAKRLDIPRRIYVASNAVLIQPEHVETDEKRKQLDTFKQNLKKENTVVFFSSPEDLTTKVVSDILLNLSEKPGIVSFAKRKYLPAIRSTCSSISFLGLDIQTMKRHKDVKLESVYVQSRFGRVGSPPESAATAGTASGKSISHTSSPEPQALSLEQTLSLAPNLVLLGDPGSGKSTLAKYLVTALVDSDSNISGALRAALPIRVPLRVYGEYRERSGGIGVTIRDFIEATARTDLQLDALPEGFLEFYLERKDCLLLFDGLDEIVDSHLREKVKNDIVAFALTSYPGNHAIITSRKVGYEETSFPTAHFEHLEVLPFDDGQITEYIKKWYKLEESDRRKRDAELAALEKAKENLPKELLSNPLLLSLIVILFRAGCTLPESKLEIYRSCIGTLTEKWDAAGKRLDLPENYNRVRDKKTAFARIAYWMYQQQAASGAEQRRLKYPEILGELTRYLCEREFKGLEPEAQQAAQDFLEYSAKRSIFVEDRFSHKTFHEYFAALYIYRNYCLGKTVDDLYQQIKPHLGNDSWSVVLELLLLMLDEQSGALLDALLEKILSELQITQSESHQLILAPLRTLGQLRNIGREKVDELISTAVKICVTVPVPKAWKRENETKRKEEPYHKIFSALGKLPSAFHASMVRNLQAAAQCTEDGSDLLPIVAFHYELSLPLESTVEQIIPNWQAVREDLAKRHLSAFYRHVPHVGTKPSERIEQFLRFFGRDKLFKDEDLLFRTGSYFIPIAEFSLRMLAGETEAGSYELAVTDFLGVSEIDFLLTGLVIRSAGEIGVANSPELIVEHFATRFTNPRKYLVDWLILVRILNNPGLHPAIVRRTLRKIKSAIQKGNTTQKFYGALLLGKPVSEAIVKSLQVGSEIQAALLEYSRLVRSGSTARLSNV